MNFQFNDGGRAGAGYKGTTGDCVVRAIAIATDLPYTEVYKAINLHCQRATWGRRKKRAKESAREGVLKDTIREYLTSLGWRWTPTMQIGSGCKVHLRANELPKGRLIVSLSRHLAAVIDGVLHDLDDCSREGTRCVYGYWQQT